MPGLRDPFVDADTLSGWKATKGHSFLQRTRVSHYLWYIKRSPFGMIGRQRHVMQEKRMQTRTTAVQMRD
jgi:hypothetical protein